MKIYVNNSEEYIAAIVALCGEADKDKLAPRSPVSYRSITRAIKNLSDEYVINKHRYDDGRTFLRLSRKTGPGYLNDISPALLGHAKLLISQELNYYGDKATRKRERCCYELYFGMHNLIKEIDFIKTEYSPNFFDLQSDNKKTEGTPIVKIDGTPLPLEEIAKKIKGKNLHYLTKKLVKKRTEENKRITRTSSRGSRLAGTLIAGKQIYQTYALEKAEGTSWKADAEAEASAYISGVLEQNADPFKGIRMLHQCILLYPNKEEAEKMITLDTKGIRIDPCKIYEKSLVVPAFQLSENLAEIFKEPGWEEKMIKTLFPESTKKGIEDATLSDGTEVYNFIGANLNHIRYSAGRILRLDSPVVLLIQPWMKDAIKNLFSKSNIEIVAIDEDHLSLIGQTIKTVK